MAQTAPTIEALIRSPLGEVRVFIADDGQPRTEVRMTFAPSDDAAQAGEGMAEVALRAVTAVRALTATLRPSARGEPDEPSPFEQWLAERCVLEASAVTSSMTLYADFRDWWSAQGYRGDRTMSARAFGDAMRRHDVFSRKDGEGRKVRVGIRLRTVGEAAAGAQLQTISAPPPGARLPEGLPILKVVGSALTETAATTPGQAPASPQEPSAQSGQG